MKKRINLLLALTLVLFLGLTACNQQDLPLEERVDFTMPPGAATMTCRVMEEEDGALLLAKADGGTADVFTASCREADVRFQDPGRSEIQEGDLVVIGFDGGIMETYPAQLGEVEAVWVQAEGFDDTAALCLEVFEDLAEEDAALAHGAQLIGLDLSQTALSPAEQSAVALLLEWDTGLTVLQGTMEELADQGYIDMENLYWEEGYFLSFTETEWTDTALTFSAQLWKSGLGAMVLCDCTTTRTPNGPWSDYTVGAVAVS